MTQNPMNPPWTEEELILALDLYLNRCLPPNTLPRDTDPEIQELSRTLKVRASSDQHPIVHEQFRSPSAVKGRIYRFCAVNPDDDRGGEMVQPTSFEKEVWHRWAHDPDALRRKAKRIAEQALEGPTSPRPRPHQPKFIVDAKIQHEVSKRAIEAAKKYWSERSHQVWEVEEAMPYDLHCTTSNGDANLHVIVKGSIDDGSQVRLTPQEIKHARHHREVALTVVSEVEVHGTHGHEARGGELRVLFPWQTDDGDLTPSEYLYTLPLSDR